MKRLNSARLAISKVIVLLPVALTAGAVRPCLAQQEPSVGRAFLTHLVSTTEVSRPDVAVAPDDGWMAFTVLGHVLRAARTGGTAEQLTWGPGYRRGPSISPDGARIAMVAVGAGEQEEIQILDLATKQLSTVIVCGACDRVVWTPDGSALVYLQYREPPPIEPKAGGFPAPLARVRRVSIEGAPPIDVTEGDAYVRSVFVLQDGRVGWAEVIRHHAAGPDSTVIRARRRDGSVEILGQIAGYVDRVVPSADNRTLYVHQYDSGQGWIFGVEQLLALSLPGGHQRVVTALWSRSPTRPAFAVSPSGQIVLGEAGQLWQLESTSGRRIRIPFNGTIAFEAAIPPAHRTPEERSSPTVLNPRPSPDGALFFEALGRIWRQGESGEAVPVTYDVGLQCCAQPSPDGSRLGYINSKDGRRQVLVLDLASGTSTAVGEGRLARSIAWSPDAKRLIFSRFTWGGDEIVEVDVEMGRSSVAGRVRGGWSGRPSYGPDGQAILVTTLRMGKESLIRIARGPDERAAAVELPRNMRGVVVDPRGNWVAFGRDREIWIGEWRDGGLDTRTLRRVSQHGGRNFGAGPDGQNVVYAAQGRVWIQPVVGGDPVEWPLGLPRQERLHRVLLLRDVRILDFESGAFGATSSMLVEDGRIKAMGENLAPPAGAEIVNVDGRFAVPGLFHFHVHSDWGDDHAGMLATGITSVRDVGGTLERLHILGELGRTSAPVPRHFYSGEILLGPEPFWHDRFLHLGSEADARSAVQRHVADGVGFIKVHEPISWALQRVIAEEARRLGIPMIGHGRSVEQITRSIGLGYAILEHAPPTNRLYDDILGLMAAAQTGWTVHLLASAETVLGADQPELWQMTSIRPTLIDLKVLRGIHMERSEAVARALTLGVPIFAGADPAPEWGGYRTSLHRELSALVQAGLSALQVLRLATKDAAAALGLNGEFGDLLLGMRADILLLDENPLTDIRRVMSPWRVIREGVMFDPSDPWLRTHH